MNGVGALVAILAHALVVHFYAQVGVPVSTSQAIIGAVIGVGLINGRTICATTLVRILQAWLMTPVLAGFVTVILVRLFVT